MKKDDVLINKVIEEAGLLSRAAARTKALGGAVKQAAGDVATAITGKKPSPEAGWRGKYTQGKQEQILKTLSNDIIKDLTKLKLVPTGSPLNPTDLQKTLTQYISKYTGVGATPASTTPPASTTQSGSSSTTSTPPANTTPATPPASTASSGSSSTTSTPATPPAPANTSTSSTPTVPATPPASTTPPETEAPETPIPLGSTITGKMGGKEIIYRYSSPEEVAQDNKLTPNPNANPENAKWYVLSKPNKKTGQSSMAFDNPDSSDPNIQSSISAAWQKKNATEQQQQKQAKTPTFESFKNYFWK